MQFKIHQMENENIHRYPTEDLQIAKKFAENARRELGDFLLGVVVFGSSARREKANDIDILIVTDDTAFQITDALVQTYRLIIEKLVTNISIKLHITSMTYTSFWEYSRAGDPVVVNILRDGVALFDTGFYEPLQRLLKMGKIRPSEESVWRYFGRAPRTLTNSKWHILQATLDLYWAVIDSAHAALMRRHEIPPTPEHVADLLDKVFVKKKLLESKYVVTMRKFYMLMKKITHREIQTMSGVEYEKLYLEADAFVRRMKIIIEKGRF